MSREYAQTASPPATQDDAGIMQAAQSDSAQFAHIYQRYFQRIFAYCLRHVGNREEAEDLTSFVFIYAFRSLKNYRGGSVAAWLFRIAYGTVMDHLRQLARQQREVSFEAKESQLASETPEPLDRIMLAETHAILQELIASLPEEDQQLLILKIDGGLTSQEIGEIIGKSPGAVRTQLHRVIKRLREQYRRTEERK